MMIYLIFNISILRGTILNDTFYIKKNNLNAHYKNHLININVDMMENKKINSDTIVKKLMDIWKEDPINSFRTLLRKLINKNIYKITKKKISKIIINDDSNETK